MTIPYDFLIVGAGLFGATFARLATDQGLRCRVIDRRSHLGGNCYTKELEGIHVHAYGPHIFHTDARRIWAFINRFAEFNGFINRPLARHGERLYSLPFNMYTYNQVWGVTTPDEAMAKIAAERLQLDRPPANLEEQALSMVGETLYRLLIEGYTKKQWQRHPRDLPPEIIKRLPLRFTFDNNYFNDRYQGIPVGGYTALFEKLLDGVQVDLNVDFFPDRAALTRQAQYIVFTGRIDEYFGFGHGELAYRTLRFEHEVLPVANFQGNAVINETSAAIPYTRVIEHKHFEWRDSPTTVVTHEYPEVWRTGSEAYYPINDSTNARIFKQYRHMADQETRTIFGGRLAEYRYYDMHQVIGSAMAAFNRFNQKVNIEH